MSFQVGVASFPFTVNAFVRHPVYTTNQNPVLMQKNNVISELAPKYILK